jgi:hypothetical protein
VYLTATVTVLNPDLTASTLNVLGTSTLVGSTKIGTAQAQTSLGVNGSITTTGAANLNGGASVGQTLNAANAGISGSLTVSGLLNALGPVAMRALGGARSISPGSYTAGSDGFVAGAIWAAGDAGKKSNGWIWGSCNGVAGYAYGGNVISWLDIGTWSSHWVATPVSHSFVIPVPKGAAYGVGYSLWKDNQVNPGYAFWWIPLAAAGAADLTAVGDAELLAAPPVMAVEELSTSREGAPVRP